MQKYEEYWSITLEYSDIFGEKFNNTLKEIVNFINSNNIQLINESNFPGLYSRLQSRLNTLNPKSDQASTRKSINQFVKLGFIKPFLKGYVSQTVDFLNESDKENKRMIFSRIIYEYSSFRSSVTNSSESREINFLIKTLEEVDVIDQSDLSALMTVDVANSTKGYLTRSELQSLKREVSYSGFTNRKYNQIGYLKGILRNLTDITFKNDKFYFMNDKFNEEIKLNRTLGRDQYLQRIYKVGLIEESKKHYKKSLCYLEKLEYPSLIASHIKPFVQSNAEEQFDINNGLLLSRNMDYLFDQGYITFDKEGKILVSNNLSKDVSDVIKNLSIDKFLINEQRIKYLDYHRNNVFKI